MVTYRTVRNFGAPEDFTQKGQTASLMQCGSHEELWPRVFVYEDENYVGWFVQKKRIVRESVTMTIASYWEKEELLQRLTQYIKFQIDSAMSKNTIIQYHRLEAADPGDYVELGPGDRLRFTNK
ncbi:hypothetical protein STEG23_012896 [Scotinomys teguina]